MPPKGALVRTEKIDNITAYTLPSNGLRVLYAHIPGSETVTTSIVYLVGSRHEETGDTGLAHMLEHMLFKPTRGKGVKWKDLENRGAHLNATTWLDRTLYYFTLPKEHLGDMLQVEADRMRNTLLTDAEFIPERANVLSEYEIQNSNPGEVLSWNVIATAFQNHGYHHDTIGWRSDIEGYTTLKLKRFYDRYYWPNNATLIVAGDIDESFLNASVTHAFGHLKKGETYVGPHRIDMAQQGQRRTTLVRETPLRIMYVGYKAPAFTHPDWWPLMLGMEYLTRGETSPLYKALVDTHRATDVDGTLYPTHDPYLAYFTIHGREHVSYDDIESVFMKCIHTVTHAPLTAKALLPYKEMLLAEEAKSRDGSRHIALTLSEYVASGDWRNYPRTFDAILRVTPRDVLRALKTYLVPHRSTIGTLHTP